MSQGHFKPKKRAAAAKASARKNVPKPKRTATALATANSTGPRKVSLKKIEKRLNANSISSIEQLMVARANAHGHAHSLKIVKNIANEQAKLRKKDLCLNAKKNLSNPHSRNGKN